MELALSPHERDRKEGQALFADWQRARSRMYTELVAKLSHYQQLPYKLLQLGHHKPEQVTLAAQTCLKLWEIGGPGCKHRQSRRFLDPTFEADGASPGDPSLLPLVKRLASGESMLSSPDFDPLIRWVARINTFADDTISEESSPWGSPLPVFRATLQAILGQYDCRSKGNLAHL